MLILLEVEFLEFPIDSGYYFLIRWIAGKDCLPLCGQSLKSTNFLLVYSSFFSLMQLHMKIFCLTCQAICILFQKWFSIPMYSSVFSTSSCSCFKVSVLARHRWLIPVILATQETEIRRVTVWSQCRQIVCETLSQKNPSKKMTGGVAQGVGPEFKPQYWKKISFIPYIKISWL
jgi:hypothetical protein